VSNDKKITICSQIVFKNIELCVGKITHIFSLSRVQKFDQEDV